MPYKAAEWRRIMIHEMLRTKMLGGALTDAGNYLRGTYRGYYLVLEPAASGKYLIRVNAHASNDPNNVKLQAFLDSKSANYMVAPRYFELLVNLPQTADDIPDAVNGALDPVIDFLSAGGYVSGCECCGGNTPAPECYNVNGTHRFICANCPDTVKQNYRNSQKGAFFPGICGAFVGALIGGALWILIYRLGYIAGIAGAVSAICAMKGYELLGKRLDMKGIIGSVVIMIATIFLASRISWSWDMYDILREYDYDFKTIFLHFSEILDTFEASGDYIKELLIGYGLTAVCSVGYIIEAVRSGRTQNCQISKES